ncbi:hypothetical protein [uncultured Draconibacterium sp.]|uniref:hypothetical protein n=1 Tax=uncultured Draconibacterium sp. TaxID=1573823 RepID=UPI0025DB86EB|nr:hypothetical protein [uncultured Draconibacterium sp.]
MKNQKVQIVLILFLACFFFQNSNAASNFVTTDKSWELVKNEKDILIYYRWIEFENGGKTREMKAEFTIDAEISKIVKQFSASENYLKWAVGIKSCDIYQTSDTLWYTHTIMNYPWPYNKKDLVTRHYLKDINNGVVININADPDFIAVNDKIERMKNYKGFWEISVLESNKSKIRYQVISYEKPIVPRFIQDPIIQNQLIKSFVKLKKLAEEE